MGSIEEESSQIGLERRARAPGAPSTRRYENGYSRQCAALEQQLTTALRALSAQYAQAQQQQATQVDTLRRQVETLQQQVATLGQQADTLARQVAQLNGACDGLGPGLQDARRDVTWTLEVMRQPTWSARVIAGRSGTLARVGNQNGNPSLVPCRIVVGLAE